MARVLRNQSVRRANMLNALHNTKYILIKLGILLLHCKLFNVHHIDIHTVLHNAPKNFFFFKFLIWPGLSVLIHNIYSQTNLLKVASTCSFLTNIGDLEDQITKFWLKACPVNSSLIIPRGDLDKGAVWYLDYIEALVLLTVSMKDLFHRSSSLLKVRFWLNSINADNGVDSVKYKLKLV